jgi:mannose-6-phosphate isomerase-like protein (cupin superfamily)
VKTSLRATLAAGAGAAALWLAHAGLAAEAPPAVLDALFARGRQTLALAALAERVALAPGEAIRVVEIGRDAHASHHAVAIRGAETPHRHDRHDLLVVMLRGHGRMRMGDELRPVGEGSILWVPRGAVHAFHNEAPEPAIAIAVYTPPFDGKDRVEEADSR